jgi:hypothetical protein
MRHSAEASWLPDHRSYTVSVSASAPASSHHTSTDLCLPDGDYSQTTQTRQHWAPPTLTPITYSQLTNTAFSYSNVCSRSLPPPRRCPQTASPSRHKCAHDRPSVSAQHQPQLNPKAVSISALQGTQFSGSCVTLLPVSFATSSSWRPAPQSRS